MSENTVYFIKSQPEDAKSRHLYSVRFPQPGSTTQHSSQNKAKCECLTCSLTITAINGETRPCETVEANFSPSGEFYLVSCSGDGLPTIYLKSTRNPDRGVGT